MDKLDISILDKDGKPLNVGEPEIQQVGEKDGVPQYVLVYKGKIQKYQSIITLQFMTFTVNDLLIILMAISFWIRIKYHQHNKVKPDKFKLESRTTVEFKNKKTL